jgi:hypothetical protein
MSFFKTKEKKQNNEAIKMNVKGQRVSEGEGATMNASTLEKDLYRKSSGPPMLNMRTRIKIWGAMFGVGLYFYATYKLIRYRLNADDLDLMEREVNEEFKIKRKINEL